MSFPIPLQQSSWHTALLSEEPYVSAETMGDLQVLLRQMDEAAEHYRIPESRHPASLATRFHDLVRAWRADTRGLSSLERIAMHPAYQQIIGMGPRALPLVLKELETRGGHWFWALRAITGAEPVSPAQRGRVDEMTISWLRWARSQGISW